MVKDVFNINELFVQFNELDSRLMGMVRSHLVCKPKLRYSHDEELSQTSNMWERGEFGTTEKHPWAFIGFRKTL
jgi:hypothetical protein